jgi:nanoRNase/pAp phosphatase (c-di-AMP/oligoRNAs hydrolase)
MSQQQDDFQKLITKSKEVLIVVSEQPSDDAICGAFAIARILEKMQKTSSLLLNFEIPQRLSFLEKPKNTISNLSGIRDFVLLFNTSKNKILNIKHEEKSNQYEIRITPQKGTIDPRDFSFMPADFRFDLIIILGAENIEKLGKSYAENTDLFFEVPKINLDNHSGNSEFGQLNIIDMTSSSISEIISQITLEKYENILDKDIAQKLLAGIISATESFQKPNTTPKSMIMAAKLMKYKADQPTIIRYLYKTKSMPFLKLWGRAMARLNWDEKRKLCWSLISAEDFVQSHADSKDIPFVLEQIKENFFQGKIFAVIHSENPEKTKLSLQFSDSKMVQDAALFFEKESQDNRLEIEFKNQSLVAVEKIMLEKINQD